MLIVLDIKRSIVSAYHSFEFENCKKDISEKIIFRALIYIYPKILCSLTGNLDPLKTSPYQTDGGLPQPFEVDFTRKEPAINKS